MSALRFRGEVGIALAVLALAAFVGYETFSITVSPGYARVGPRVVPIAVAGLLAFLGAGLLVAAFRGGWANASAADRRVLPLVLIGGGLAAYVVLLKPVGFIAASTVLFMAVARAFQSTRPLRDGIIGAAIATSAFALFTLLLQLPLPAGWLWFGGR